MKEFIKKNNPLQP